MHALRASVREVEKHAVEGAPGRHAYQARGVNAVHDARLRVLARRNARFRLRDKTRVTSSALFDRHIHTVQAKRSPSVFRQQRAQARAAWGSD